MNAILRDPAAAAESHYDLIIVGGGITGACVALESARRGLRPLLLERGDFGSETSANSLRILHGGLRYLQTLDLRRVFTSIRDRRWFCRHFPELVEPLPCLMPLYGEGLRRPSVMAGALALNDLLSVHRNRGVRPENHVPRGRILSSEETLDLCPALPRRELRGGALWYDVVMKSSERLLIEILRWAVGAGATALNYTRASGLCSEDGTVVGVDARDVETEARWRFRAPVVLNCAGPWAGEVAGASGGEAAALPPSALAFNVLLERPPVAPVAMALTDPDTDHTYFIVPWNGRILAGTEHVEWGGGTGDVAPTAEQVEALLERLRRVVPGLDDLTRGDVVRVMPGLLPAEAPGTSAPRSDDILVDHGERGGMNGFHTVVGVKFTTAPRLAARAVDRVYGRGGPSREAGSQRPEGVRSDCGEIGSPDWLACLEDEAVLHLDDLLLRRIDWPDQAPLTDAALADLGTRRQWSDERRTRELERFRNATGGWRGS